MVHGVKVRLVARSAFLSVASVKFWCAPIIAPFCGVMLLKKCVANWLKDNLGFYWQEMRWILVVAKSFFLSQGANSGWCWLKEFPAEKLGCCVSFLAFYPTCVSNPACT